MKHIYFSLVLLFLSCSAFGQETMLGLTRIYNTGSGGLFRITPGGEALESELIFSVPLSEGVGKLLEHSNGRVYGVTCRGGFWNKGVLYSMDELGQDFTLEYHFGQDNDFIPRAGVVEGDGGAILGIKGEEETKGIGEVYQFDPNSSTLSIIRQFTLLEALGTVSPLLIASDRKIYGTSPYGGNAGKGNIFRLNQDGSEFEMLYEFGQSDLHVPAPEVIEHVNGKIYGVGHYYGPNSGDLTSRLWRINKDGSNFEFLESLPERHIISGKIFADDKGNLYGVFPERGPFLGGGVFKTDSLGKRFQALHHFDYKEEDGRQYPSGGLILGRDGLLYGVCAGKVYPNSDGAVFRINRYGDDFEWIQSFDYYHGDKPKEGLIQTSAGHFLGTTTKGALGDDGVVFGFDSGDDTVTVHKQLGEASIGIGSSERLLKASDDRLIGLTYGGGEYGYGMIFRTDICGRNIEIIHSFDYFQRMNYGMNVIEGIDGKIYGAGTGYGSRWSFLFSLNQDGSDWSIIFNFEDVLAPVTSIIQTEDGKIYGLAFRDNFSGTYGEIISINSDGTDFLHEYNFDQGGEVVYVTGDLMEHSNGKLYGTHRDGVFAFNKTSRVAEIFQLGLYQDPDFGLNSAPLWEGENGRLFGTGVFYKEQLPSQEKIPQGFLYSILPDGTDYQEHFSFKDIEGIIPSGGISGDASGKPFFYSANTHISWGESGPFWGTIYKFDPVSGNTEIVQSFREDQAIVPYGTPVFVRDSCPTFIGHSEAENPQDSTILDRSIFPNPTSEIFEVHSGAEGIGEVFLRDLQGRLFLTQALDPQTGSTTIDMRSYASGTYLITISAGKTTTTHKVVKW